MEILTLRLVLHWRELGRFVADVLCPLKVLNNPCIDCLAQGIPLTHDPCLSCRFLTIPTPSTFIISLSLKASITLSEHGWEGLARYSK